MAQCRPVTPLFWVASRTRPGAEARGERSSERSRSDPSSCSSVWGHVKGACGAVQGLRCGGCPQV